MGAQTGRLNSTALLSIICSIMSPMILAALIFAAAMQHVGHLYFETAPFEPWTKPLMLMLSVAAIVFGYRAESQIAMSNGFYSGAKLASVGRTLGYCWGALILITILIWGL